MDFNFSKSERDAIVSSVVSSLEKIYNAPREELSVSKSFSIAEVKAKAETFSFNQENDAVNVMHHVIDSLKNEAVHVSHPSYFGLFNPRPSFPSVLADVINSYLNPQLAAWSHSPYASEIERLVIKAFCDQFGYSMNNQDGTFCTGGAESNLTAVLCGLQSKFPNYSDEGLIGMEKLPTIYCSAESHHSIEKAARIVGLGKVSIRKVAVHENLTMKIQVLEQMIQQDRENNMQPFMVVGTAGTTGAGSIDALDQLALVCQEENLWLHVDAAYGGGAIITKLKQALRGIELSDSITLDLHKWFSVPMATSLFLTRDTNILHQTFGVRTAYMPADGDPQRIIDPYVHSMQWSRRFIGLKIYLPLAVFGWSGYSDMLNHQIEMGNIMRTSLKFYGWQIENQAELPIICFSHPALIDDESVQHFVDECNVDGETWFSTYPINGKLTLRAQIANYDTKTADVEKFVRLITEKISTSININSIEVSHENN